MKCAIKECGKTIPKNRYRWTSAYRKADGVLGPKGFEAEFCSVECFLRGVEGVEQWAWEQKLFDVISSVGGTEVHVHDYEDDEVEV